MTNVTASQPIHGCCSATAKAAIPAITAMAGTNASPASVSRQTVCGSPSVIPAPRPLPSPAKNINTVEPEQSGGHGGQQPPPARYRTGQHRLTQSRLLVAVDPQYGRDDVGGGGGGQKLRHRGVDAVGALRFEHPGEQFVLLRGVEQRLGHRAESQAGQEQSDAPPDDLTALQRQVQTEDTLERMRVRMLSGGGDGAIIVLAAALQHDGQRYQSEGQQPPAGPTATTAARRMAASAAPTRWGRTSSARYRNC